MTTTTSPHDPTAVAGWRKCKCEWCLEELELRGLSVKEEPDITSKPTEPAPPTKAERNATICKLFAAGATIQELAEEFDLTPMRIRQLTAKVKREE